MHSAQKGYRVPSRAGRTGISCRWGGGEQTPGCPGEQEENGKAEVRGATLEPRLGGFPWALPFLPCPWQGSFTHVRPPHWALSPFSITKAGLCLTGWMRAACPGLPVSGTCLCPSLWCQPSGCRLCSALGFTPRFWGWMLWVMGRGLGSARCCWRHPQPGSWGHSQPWHVPHRARCLSPTCCL